MLDQNTIVMILIIFMLPAVCFLYFFIFQVAINSALKEHHGEIFFNRWILVIITLIILGVYAIIAAPFSASNSASSYQPSPITSIFMIFGCVYLALEIPYQLVKSAAKQMANELQDIGNDKREAARLKSAQTLAAIISEKLKVSCELQAFTSNEEFVFLTYIVNNKPVATRLKLNQADNADSWKKLGEWIMQNYQKS